MIGTLGNGRFPRRGFFDLMHQSDGVSIADAAIVSTEIGAMYSDRLRIPGGGVHHVHRLYGKISANTSRQAMHEFAEGTGGHEDRHNTNATRGPGQHAGIHFETLGCLRRTTNPKTWEVR
jgi:hypothetical protein